jgi:hypothetical protein
MRSWLASLIVAPLVLALFAAVAPYVALPWLVASVVIAFAFVSAETLIVSALVPPLAPRAVWWIAIPIALLAGVAAAGSAIPSVLAAAIVTASLLGGGTLVGAIVGSRIEAAGHLVVVAIVSGLVDAFSVLHPSGPTAQIVRIDAALSVLVLPWPILSTDRIEPILGLGDVTFTALYLAAARRHELSLRRSVIALALALAVTLAAVTITQMALPALPFLGAAIVAAHPEARRIPRADRAKAAMGIGALIVVFVVLFLVRG